MILSRRKTIALIGGGVVTAVGAAAGAFLATRTPKSALAPWAAAGNYDDPRLRALSFALLAPSPHNRQPWVGELIGDKGIAVYRDPARNIPKTDPFDRQLIIGMGCFTELMVQAAAEEGLGVDLTLFPDGEELDAPVFRATFTGTATADPLFAQILHRHTNRNAYDMTRPVPEGDLAKIVEAVTTAVQADATRKGTEVTQIRELALEAMILEIKTPRTHHESVQLTRIGRAEIEANPDGISLGGPMMDTLGLLGILTREAAEDPESRAFETTLQIFRDTFTATPAFFWIATHDNRRVDQIAVGRSWVRVHLAATGLGLAMQPVSQSLQEYPEMASHRETVHELLAQPGETIQMLGRVGYGPPQSPSPRWPLETRLRAA